MSTSRLSDIINSARFTVTDKAHAIKCFIAADDFYWDAELLKFIDNKQDNVEELYVSNIMRFEILYNVLGSYQPSLSD